MNRRVRVRVRVHAHDIVLCRSLSKTIEIDVDVAMARPEPVLPRAWATLPPSLPQKRRTQVTTHLSRVQPGELTDELHATEGD